MSDNKSIKIHKKWHPILGEEIPLIEPYHYIKLCKIITPPKLPVREGNGSVAAVLPYIRQKVKMWGADVFRAENIRTLMEENDDDEDEDEDELNKTKNQLSRFDCIASLFSSAECTVVQDIFQTLSQFPIAFPLVIPKLDEAEKFKVMLPLLTGPVIKWEANPGTIIENHLFSDPFKLIVAVRIGTNSQGKSTILNQLMNSNYTFSSRSEPRAEYGIPHMISGSIEFTWLTQETCKVGLWKDILEDYYKGGAKEIVLLANLHGGALDYPDQIEFLKQFPSSFLVFLMPGSTENQINDFKTLVGPKKVVFCCVNNKSIKTKYIIDTISLIQDKTLKKVRMMFKEALGVNTSSFKNNELNLGKSLQLTEGIELPESQSFIDFVRSRNCRHIKLEVMQLQRRQSNDGLQIWQNNPELQELIFSYKAILKLPLNKRRRALAHLEREISKLSMMESSKARNRAVLKKEELRKFSLVNRNQENEKKIRDEIANIWAEVDSMSLGLEHFYRELGQVYKIFSVNYPNNEIVSKLPKLYSELLISGHTIELLDGDAGTISEAWFSAICKHVCEKYPRLRIFVISILGLQSSGKSTLLNALFACRFAVSVGRCTRGLFMRLLFLEKDLSDQLNIDAIILIDTEGLGAPEKMNDPESEKKDRMLATFAMGVSNLTILNVLGESMRDLTEILQIAIVTMARLEKVGMAPDIRMVQHVSERNAAKLSEPEEKFRAALQEALKIAEEQDLEMRISNTDCLRILDERIRKGQLLKQFRPFKNGATAYAPPSEQYHEDVVNLYNSIIDDCKNSQTKTEFSEWHLLIQNYWKAVSHEDFAVRFKNIKEIYEFIDLGKRITKLKEIIDRAFLKHEESIMQKIRSKIQNSPPNDRSNTDLCFDEFLKLIEKKLENVPGCINQGNGNCKECEKTNEGRIELEKYLKEKNNESCEIEAKQTIENYIKVNRQSAREKLNQMLNAIFIRNGVSTESLDIINNHLEKILKNIPDEGFSDYERKQKVEEIWNSLRNYILSKNSVIPVVELIDQEVKCEYSQSFTNSQSFTTGLFRKYQDGFSPDLSECKAYKNFFSISRCLESNNLFELQNQIDNSVDKILKERTYHFCNGIVRGLKNEISQIIDEKKYLPEFKWNVHLYALLKFKPKMIRFQERWDKENTPLGMFDQKKEEYFTIIDNRLQYGYSLHCEGHIVGNYLLTVINKKAIDAGSDERKEAVRRVAWLTCTESIRLKYFERLADQVQNGDKKEAIQHFLDPKQRIEDWFKDTIDNNKSGNPEKKYKDTFNAEFKRVLQEIRNCQSFEDIKNFVNNYMTQVDKVDYKLDLKDEVTKEDLNMFRRTIEEELNTKREGYYSRRETFQNPSDDESIMKMLGCTEACYWCRALCWGSRDHHENSGETKIHHTSHQPEGLSGCSYRNSRELIASSCHNAKDDLDVWYYGKEDPTKWGIAKAQDFSNWKFEPHYIYFFNDLMCWFFEKLHNDLAKARNKKPSTKDNMRKHGCLDLDYHGIISTLKTKIQEI